jgi:aryl-alcohol dehydrogenase-like predicted oxidoreductase
VPGCEPIPGLIMARNPMRSMERRKLGKTGESLSVVGFGGILVMDETPAEAERLVGQAIERGVNYFDVAPSYGNAEERLGPALKPYRKSVFLACKTTERGKTGAASELHQSLKRLCTDHVDLYQLHAINTQDEVKRVLAPDGALAAFKEARAAGLARFIGFSSHSEEAALAIMAEFEFATVMFPFNRYAWHLGGFGAGALGGAQEKGMGILALKALAKRAAKKGEEKPWKKAWYVPVENYDEALLAMRFTLSLPVTAAVSPGHEKLFLWACDAAEAIREAPPGEAAAEPELKQEEKPVFDSLNK